MKVVILAGGLGTRLSEETGIKPKPMVEIGGKPILWHIMKHYSHYGFNEFIICTGYKGYYIKEYFANYNLHTSDITIDLKTNNITTHHNTSEPWKVTIIDTGELTMTGGRLLRIKKYVGNNTFLLTYGDGLSDVNLDELVQLHNAGNQTVTITAIQPQLRFGTLDIHGIDITSFEEKPEGEGKYISGGFFVCNPDIFNYIADDSTVLEKTVLPQLAKIHKLSAYKHKGFWHAMDTLRDKHYLESLWQTNHALWKVWE